MSLAEARALAEALEHAARRRDADAVEHLVDELGQRLAHLGPVASVDEIRTLLAVMNRSEALLTTARDDLRRELDHEGWSEPAELVDQRG